MNQLTSFTRDNGHTQGWTLDAQGNFQSVTTDGTPESRTHNAQNQLTSVGASALTFDANGNLTTDETGRTLIYDAWNRLVAVKAPGGAMLIEYRYDAVNRRVSENRSGIVTDLYYSDQWQVLEERVGGVAKFQYVWSPVYVDAMVLRDRDTDGDGILDERLYVLQDANFNVTALVDANGNVVERFAQTPYGVVTVYDANWNIRPGGSLFSWVYFDQGGRFDPLTGLYHRRRRDESATLGRPVQIDPILLAGGTNFYLWEGNNPANRVDPFGLQGGTSPDWRVFAEQARQAGPVAT